MGPDEDEIERELKLAHVDMYNKSLTEREKRKRQADTASSQYWMMCAYLLASAVLPNSMASSQGSRDSVVHACIYVIHGSAVCVHVRPDTLCAHGDIYHFMCSAAMKRKSTTEEK